MKKKKNTAIFKKSTPILINQSLNDLRLNRESSSWWRVETEGYVRHKAGRTCIPPITTPEVSPGYLKALSGDTVGTV